MKRLIGVALAAQVLAACSNVTPPASAGSQAPRYTIKPATPIAPAVVRKPAQTAFRANALSAGVAAGPDIAALAIDSAAAARALTAFQSSCPALSRRSDYSGLTMQADWATACAAAPTWDKTQARRFFTENFETVQVGPGTSYATGYYEPEIAGSRVPAPGYPVPIYRRPPDVIEVDLGQFSDQMIGKKVTGRVVGTGLVPYYTRAEIEDGALAGKGLELAYAADPIEFFFLQVQGSGRLKLPDGSTMQIAYGGQNGRDYTGIGALMRDRGLVVPGQLSMQGIMAYLRAHPDEGRAIMRENKSWVFFREITGAGPIGALGIAVTGQGSVAADPAYVPLGAPVFLSMDRADATGLWVAQDTGGAIKGANRFDTFWGAGDQARVIAGGMSARGTAFILLPKGVLARLQTGSAAGGGTTP
jgi:membrane-bound lytic murein transglycosylase A